jgi:hypothetical protein
VPQGASGRWLLEGMGRADLGWDIVTRTVAIEQVINCFNNTQVWYATLKGTVNWAVVVTTCVIPARLRHLHDTNCPRSRFSRQLRKIIRISQDHCQDSLGPPKRLDLLRLVATFSVCVFTSFLVIDYARSCRADLRRNQDLKCPSTEYQWPTGALSKSS